MPGYVVNAPRRARNIRDWRPLPGRRGWWESPVREVRHAMGRLNQVTVEPTDA